MNNGLNIPIPTASSLALSTRPNSPMSPISPISPISLSSPSSPTSSNPDDILHLVNPEFPPRIDPKVLGQSLFNRRKRSKKMLNEFFIYRKEFVQELKRLNLKPKQTKVSSLASASWHKQPSNVKDEYRRLARETEKWFMAERQREANECLRTESNESSPDDSSPVASPLIMPPSEANYQLDPNHPLQQANYFAPLQVTYPLNTMNTSGYIWPYYYCDMHNISPMQMPSSLVQETNTYNSYYRQQ